MIMIQETFIAFKQFFNSSSFDILNPLSLDEFKSLELFLLNSIGTSRFHTHCSETCSSPRLSKVSSYKRNYITFTDGHIRNEECTIPVLYCENDKHFHALLPAPVFIPYLQYSLSFVLSVLFDRFINHLKVEEITEKYEISTTTFYRWIHKYKIFYRMYLSIRTSFENSFFIELKSDPLTVLESCLDSFLSVPLEHKRRLFKPPAG